MTMTTRGAYILIIETNKERGLQYKRNLLEQGAAKVDCVSTREAGHKALRENLAIEQVCLAGQVISRSEAVIQLSSA